VNEEKGLKAGESCYGYSSFRRSKKLSSRPTYSQLETHENPLTTKNDTYAFTGAKIISNSPDRSSFGFCEVSLYLAHSQVFALKIQGQTRTVSKKSSLVGS